MAQTVNGQSAVHSAGDLGLIPGLGRPPEKGVAPHSSILAWRIAWMEEPGRLRSADREESDMTERLTYLLSSSHSDPPSLHLYGQFWGK